MSKRTIDEAYLREIVGAFNRRDVEAIGSYFAPQGRFYTARGKTERGMELVGPAAITRYLADRFKLISDMGWHDEVHFVSGNRALSEWTVRGKHANGEVLAMRGCDIWEFDSDGKILVKDTFWKTVEK